MQMKLVEERHQYTNMMVQLAGIKGDIIKYISEILKGRIRTGSEFQWQVAVSNRLLRDSVTKDSTQSSNQV
jgi:hypothetical protein